VARLTLRAGEWRHEGNHHRRRHRLTTALMLHARGIGCEVFEQAEAVRELGVGAPA
jgi:hypothetical protein